MLATISDDTWNELNMQHITPNWKRMGLFRHPLCVGTERLKDPPISQSDNKDTFNADSILIVVMLFTWMLSTSCVVVLFTAIELAMGNIVEANIYLYASISN